MSRNVWLRTGRMVSIGVCTKWPSTRCRIIERPSPPRSWAERSYNVVHYTRMPRGGHFAALEQPDLLAADIRSFAASLRAE